MVAGSKIVERIVAVVDQEIILESEMQARVAADKIPDEGDPLADKHRQKAAENMLWRMIDELLVQKKADEMQIKVLPEEVDRAIDNIARENGVTRADLFAAIRGQGMDVEAYRRDLRQQLLRHKVMSLKVRGRVRITEDEGRRFYNDQVREIRSRDVFVGAHILISVPPGAGAATVAERRSRAQEALRQIREGKPFADVAARMSDDSMSAEQGGVIGRHMPSDLHPDLARAFVDLEPGEIGGPVRTPSGFHVVKLIEREASGVLPFADVKNRIMAQLIEREMKRQEEMWIQELRRSAYVDIRL